RPGAGPARPAHPDPVGAAAVAESILAPPLPFGARRRASEGLLRPIARRFARHRLAVIGLVLIVALFLAAALASLLAPYDPEQLAPIDRLKPPLTAHHLLGT